MSSRLARPVSRQTNLPFMVMIAVSVLAHLILLGASAVRWVLPVHLPADQIISVKLTEKPVLNAPKTARLAENNNQGQGNTAKQGKLATHSAQRGAPDPIPAQPAEPAADQAMPATIAHPKPGKRAITPATPSNEAAPAFSSANLLGQIDNLMASKGDDGLRDSPQETGNANGSGDSARRYEWARYQTDWRQKIERIGNMNYPDEARRQNVHGSVTLEVIIMPSGALKSSRVLRGSGHNVLDDAALNIVRMSAPFSAFPASLSGQGPRKITQTFAFTKENQLSSR
ncbi:energy transducer TonB [uncultured Aquitalea sp.]|uniref:energy transducer TonB n=1 Tax=uncultured Aquitalea sp. TaxID=540272 RepID=UPI0025F0D4C7|nr:energy transducer TonB [uncultured Aquitalea sp.]